MESNAPLREAILAHSKMSEEELSQRLMLKQQELHGLLSQDGALHIIANEMGINVKQFFARPTPIASLVSGMHVFGVQGSVSRIYPVQSFDKNGKRGIVGSFLLQDPTGSIRVVAWNDQVSSLSSLHEGDTVLLQHAQVKQRQNTIEIHLLPETALKVSATIIRKLLCQINESDKMVQVHGTIVAVHELRFFEQCPRCKKRLLPQNQQWICATDGIQPPKYGYLLSLIIDDGSETRRAIFFSRQVESILRMTAQEMQKMKGDLEHFTQEKNKLLGKELLLTGNVKKNEFFSRIELHVVSLTFPAPEEIGSFLEHLHNV